MGTRKGILTARVARALRPGQWASRALASRGAGTLEARALRNGKVTYYVRFTTRGRQERVPLGSLPYRVALEEATALSLRYQRGERDLPATLRTERGDVDGAGTLGDLLTAYVDDLDRQGKASARTVRGSLHKHVCDAFPKLWTKPAEDVTTDDLVDVVGRLISADKATMARQVRAYVRAAYTAATRARQDATALPALRELHITANPAADVAPVAASKPRDRALSVAELRAYWERIAALPGIDGALLRFHLLTGGQRIKQLARATVDDYDADAQALRLLDTKGKRTVPRVHMVPVLPAALDAMQAMHGQGHVFTVTAGESGASYSSVKSRLQTVVKAMDKAGELERGTYTPGDLRRTVETRLAAAGVSQAVRAQLQSHGLSGIQQKHYDRYDYLAEKRAALETLQRIATGETRNVVSLGKTNRAASA